jgi:hypothetical protein
MNWGFMLGIARIVRIADLILPHSSPRTPFPAAREDPLAVETRRRPSPRARIADSPGAVLNQPPAPAKNPSLFWG